MGPILPTGPWKLRWLISRSSCAVDGTYLRYWMSVPINSPASSIATPSSSYGVAGRFSSHGVPQPHLHKGLGTEEGAAAGVCMSRIFAGRRSIVSA
jgi:hypothetical protein